MRTCKRCNMEKQDDRFTVRTDGYIVYVCKDCVNKRTRELRSENPQTYRDRVNKWLKNNLEEQEKRRLYRANHPEIYRENSRRYYEKNKHKRNRDKDKLNGLNYRNKFPEKCKAHHRINYLKSIGKIFNEPCCICGNLKTEAHHDDYSKPETVKWYCKKHHAQLHNGGL